MKDYNSYLNTFFVADATVPAVIKNCSAGPVLNAAYGEDMKCKLKKMNALVKDLKDMGITGKSYLISLMKSMVKYKIIRSYEVGIASFASRQNIYNKRCHLSRLLIFLEKVI